MFRVTSCRNNQHILLHTRRKDPAVTWSRVFLTDCCSEPEVSGFTSSHVLFWSDQFAEKTIWKRKVFENHSKNQKFSQKPTAPVNLYRWVRWQLTLRWGSQPLLIHEEDVMLSSTSEKTVCFGLRAADFKTIRPNNIFLPAGPPQVTFWSSLVEGCSWRVTD